MAGIIHSSSLISLSGNKILTPSGFGLATALGSPSIGAGFFTPDIINNAGFESSLSPLTDWTGGSPPSASPDYPANTVTRDTSLFKTGSASLKRIFSSNGTDDSARIMASLGGNYDRVWVGGDIYLTAHVTTVMKFIRFYHGIFDGALGGLFLGKDGGTASGTPGFLNYTFDTENSAIMTQLPTVESGILNTWVRFELEAWRNGHPSGYPAYKCWLNGVLQSYANGTDNIHWYGSGNNSSWADGYVIAGERGSSSGIGSIELFGTLNGGNTQAGTINLDNLSVSTLGRTG